MRTANYRNLPQTKHMVVKAMSQLLANANLMNRLNGGGISFTSVLVDVYSLNLYTLAILG